MLLLGSREFHLSVTLVPILLPSVSPLAYPRLSHPRVCPQFCSGGWPSDLISLVVWEDVLIFTIFCFGSVCMECMCVGRECMRKGFQATYISDKKLETQKGTFEMVSEWYLIPAAARLER